MGGSLFIRLTQNVLPPAAKGTIMSKPKKIKMPVAAATACSTSVLIHFDSPEALLEALCVRQFGAFPSYDNAHTKALAGTFDIETIEKAFFNHDSDGSESAPGQWETRRDQWRSFKTFLATNQKALGRDAYKEDSSLPND